MTDQLTVGDVLVIASYIITGAALYILYGLPQDIIQALIGILVLILAANLLQFLFVFVILVILFVIAAIRTVILEDQ